MNLKFRKRIYIYGVKGTIHLFLLYSLLNRKMLSIVESKRKKPTLLLDGFRYTQDKVFNTTNYLLEMWKSFMSWTCYTIWFKSTNHEEFT